MAKLSVPTATCSTRRALTPRAQHARSTVKKFADAILARYMLSLFETEDVRDCHFRAPRLWAASVINNPVFLMHDRLLVPRAGPWQCVIRFYRLQALQAS